MVTRDAFGGSAAPRHGEAGYNLVILVVAITVMNILVASAIPLWRTAIRRDKEEELIFRGWQYAEGIRLFQHRYGRLPVRLEELIEVKPRCMRQLWTDPITGKRDWVPVRVVVPGAEAPPQPEGDNPPDEKQVDPEGPPTQPGSPGTPDGSVGLGPIRGVRSRSTETSIKVLFDQTRYDHWQFTVEMLAEHAGPMQGFGVPGAVGLGTRLPTRWLGRPFRSGLIPPAMAMPPGGVPIHPPPPPNPAQTRPPSRPQPGKAPPAGDP